MNPIKSGRARVSISLVGPVQPSLNGSTRICGGISSRQQPDRMGKFFEANFDIVHLVYADFPEVSATFNKKLISGIKGIGRLIVFIKMKL